MFEFSKLTLFGLFLLLILNKGKGLFFMVNNEEEAHYGKCTFRINMAPNFSLINMYTLHTYTQTHLSKQTHTQGSYVSR